MTKPQFIFIKQKNSFSVHIENLEKLSVEQIQAIETFVSARKGIFDFESYTFVIQKKLEFNEFISLLKYSSIDAKCKEKIMLRKTDAKIEFGKYKGMSYNEVPDSYLLWLKANYRGKDRDTIDIELQARNL
ncbi:MAG: DUF3820 family protein [Sulfurimonas sp.]|nr:DUF3820 family protein [Sulfurimonas sp.]